MISSSTIIMSSSLLAVAEEGVCLAGSLGVSGGIGPVPGMTVAGEV
jgi:hypothetical protein